MAGTPKFPHGLLLLSNAYLPLNSPRVRSQEIAARVITNVLEVIEIINDQESKNYKLGAILLVIAIATWIIGLELVNTVLKGGEFQKPWFLAFLTGSCFMLNFIPEVIQLIGSVFVSTNHVGGDLSPQLSSSDLNLQQSRTASEILKLEADVNEGPIALSQKEVFSLALQMTLIYYAYNVCVMMALQYTSASNQTILGSTTAIFALCLGVKLGIDKFSVKKVVCVLFSLAGVILISVSESGPSETGGVFEPKNPKLGNCFALAGALFYALYLIVMKMKCGTGDRVTDERKLFGWIGVFSFLLGCPVLLAVDALGIEKFLLPPNKIVFFMISINAVFSVISDYVTILAMLLTSPLVTSLALTSSIPITIFVDFVLLQFRDDSLGSSSNLSIYVFGVLCILVSVVLINLNITTENEFIEEVIEDALEDAIRHDEVLSPILSPYMGSAINESAPRAHAIGVAHLSPRLNFFKKTNHGPSPLVPAPLTSEAVGFSLNSHGSSESTPLQNANHHDKLYTIDSTIDSTLDGESQGANLVVYGGLNHSFHVKMVQGSNNES